VGVDNSSQQVDSQHKRCQQNVLPVEISGVTTQTQTTSTDDVTCRSCSCNNDMSPDNSKHRMMSCSRSVWRNLIAATVGIFSRHSPANSRTNSTITTVVH